MAGDTVAIGRKEGVRWLPPDVAGPLWFWHARIEVGALLRRVKNYWICRVLPVVAPVQLEISANGDRDYHTENLG